MKLVWSLTSPPRCSPWSSSWAGRTPGRRWSGPPRGRRGCSRSRPEHWTGDSTVKRSLLESVRDLTWLHAERWSADRSHRSKIRHWETWPRPHSASRCPRSPLGWNTSSSRWFLPVRGQWFVQSRTVYYLMTGTGRMDTGHTLSWSVGACLAILSIINNNKEPH